jgi:3-deoxy-D-manno-octulosonic-acid transferase
MNQLYNFVIFLFGRIVRFLAFFDQKMNLFVEGRKETFPKLKAAIHKDDKTIWIHCASLGEFEQGRPVIEALRNAGSAYKIILSFYSPSGYEVQKNYKHADVVVYLPIDSRKKAKKFIELSHPSMAIFVKYEFWPNFLKELENAAITTLLVSGIFRKDQVFFKPYGGWLRKSLNVFDHFFVQNELSRSLLGQKGFSNVTVSGDTRFDRVASILKQDNSLDFLTEFTRDKTVFVAGSTWPDDEAHLIQLINHKPYENVAFIIAPHNINSKDIISLKQAFDKKTTVYSEGAPDSQTKVFIVDTVGLLTKIYSYADVAYVGGGFGKEGVHNVLEPAVFGIPLVIGPIYEKFEEAKDLVRLEACAVADSEMDVLQLCDSLISSSELRKKMGLKAENYIREKLGATKIILNYIYDKV